MENPWLNYNPTHDEPGFHTLDKAHALAFNKGMARERFKLAEHLEPFPYLGNPNAGVVVLLANPGVNEKEADTRFRLTPDEIAQNRRNLSHMDLKPGESTIHSTSVSGFESAWLKPRIRELVQATSLDQVSQGVFLANFHAYNSKSWYPIPYTFETQRYSFYLVGEALKRNSIIIMSRNLLGWFTAIPELYDYKNRVNFKSSRSVYITRGNLGTEEFERVKSRI